MQHVHVPWGAWYLDGRDLTPDTIWTRHIDIREPYVGFRLVEQTQ